MTCLRAVYDSVANRQNSQGSLGAASEFVDPFAAGRTGLVVSLMELLLQAFQLLVQIPVKCPNNDVID